MVMAFLMNLMPVQMDMEKTKDGIQNPTTDRDGDGCHDFEEDIDDDNDMIPDIDDESFQKSADQY